MISASVAKELSPNPFKDCKREKSDEGKKAVVSVVAHSLSVDTYITNNEKESERRKTGTFFQSLRKMFMI